MWCEGCYFNWGVGHKAGGIITTDPRQAQAWAHIQGGGGGYPPRNSPHLFCYLHPIRNFPTPPLIK